MPATRPRDKPWYTDLTIDLLIKILNNSIFHPFVASLVPLCLRAAEVPYSADAFRYSVYYAIFICILSILGPINERIAYGPPRKVDWEEEIIVITGGASGLGRCLSEVYAMRGATVAVIDITQVNAGNRVENVSYWQCDVGDVSAVAATWDEITKKLGVPTILVNNAAIVHGKQLVDLSPERVERSFRVNTMSHFQLSALFIPPLLSRQSGGTIVTVASALGKVGASHLSAYCATKGALLAYHSALEGELSKSNPMIKTLLVAPGQLSTELFGSLDQGPIRRFFGPTVEVQELAMKIVKMIDEGRGGVIAEPAYARWMVMLELMPVGVQKVLRSLAGVDTAMAGFKVKTV